jgi:hypothetical protein
MKKKLIIFSLISILLVSGLFILTGCGNSDNSGSKDKSAIGENGGEESTVSNGAEETNPDIKIANVWMKMPKNIDMVWKVDEKNTSNYQLLKMYKRDNNVMQYPESFENGVYITMDNDGITNSYYYYHFQGDYIWTSYCYFSNEGWDNWYYKGNYPSSPQSFCFGRPWNILDNYTDEHETINIEGVGAVDTVKGTDDEGYTYYYSKDLGFNVKIENNVQVWYLSKYDTSVTTGFPYALPDMETLDKLRDKPQTSVENNNETTQTVVEGEDGELIVYDD